VLDKSSGATRFTFGRSGGKEGEFAFPTNVAIGPFGDVYVTDTMNFRVQRFTSDGKFVRTYGSIGVNPGQFSRPKGVAVDRDGRIYVADAAFENVQILDDEGRPLLFFGEPGGSPQNINLPTAVVVDYDAVPLFQKYADPRFKLECVIVVASQFGNSKLNVFGLGKLEGMAYDDAKRAAPAGR
jgi:DNA-binding beta-propeller fold protein YncE